VYLLKLLLPFAASTTVPTESTSFAKSSLSKAFGLEPMIPRT
jgi:hypothetical protein